VKGLISLLDKAPETLNGYDDEAFLNTHEGIRRNRMDMKYLVITNEQNTVIPPFCVCCMKPTRTTEKFIATASETTHSFAGRTRTTRTSTAYLPICPECLKHRKQINWANRGIIAASSVLAATSTILWASLFEPTGAFWILPFLTAIVIYVTLGVIVKFPPLEKEHSARQYAGWLGGTTMDGSDVEFYFTNWQYAKLFEKANEFKKRLPGKRALTFIEKPYKNRAKSRLFLLSVDHPKAVGALILIITGVLLLIYGNNLAVLGLSL